MKSNSFFRVLAAVIFACFCSLILIAGCNDGNSGDAEPGLGETSACANSTSPCSSVTTNSDLSVVTCLLEEATCGVDLSTVISQVSEQYAVTEHTVMWVQV
jgi:hypothetical protein